MKYIALTFDDGREDNVSVAYPIMARYGLTATLFVTTGYLDGTWTRDPAWAYSGEPMTIDQLRLLRDAGWEIGLHGDWHRTSLEDWQSALAKLKSWGFDTRHIGCSLPNSQVDEQEIQHIVHTLGSETIAYIRRGRACDTKKIGNRILFAMYTYMKSSWAYRRFNRGNVMRLPIENRTKVYSVVVRHEDDPRMILGLIDALAEDSLCVLMLHSILPEEHRNYGREPWNWSAARFEQLCSGLRERKGQFQMNTLKEIVKRQNQDKVGCSR